MATISVSLTGSYSGDYMSVNNGTSSNGISYTEFISTNPYTCRTINVYLPFTIPSIPAGSTINKVTCSVYGTAYGYFDGYYSPNKAVSLCYKSGSSYTKKNEVEMKTNGLPEYNGFTTTTFDGGSWTASELSSCYLVLKANRSVGNHGDTTAIVLADYQAILTIEYGESSESSILGDQAVGSIVKLNVNGTATNFIVVHQGLPSSDYDSSCDGTWLLMENLYEERRFSGPNNSYGSSEIHSYLNETFINLFDSDIKELIQQVKIPYTNGTGTDGTLATGANGLSTKVFLLSATEVKTWRDYVTCNKEGTALDYFSNANNSIRIGYLDGTATEWYSRSPSVGSSGSSTNVCSINKYGNIGYRQHSLSTGIRPALILPFDLPVDNSGNVVIPQASFSGLANIGGAFKNLSTGYANIGGVWKELVTMYMNVGGVWKLMASGDSGGLPSGYTAANYIESTGTQYIDTGFAPSSGKMSIECSFALTTIQAWHALFGSETTGSGPWSITPLVNGSSQITFYVGSSPQIGLLPAMTDYVYTLNCTTDSNVLTCNSNAGACAPSYSGTAATPNDTFYLFTLNSANADSILNQASCMRLYSFKLYDNGKLVRDFIPCTNASGTAGLYDVANSKFYSNAGSGVFLVG